MRASKLLANKIFAVEAEYFKGVLEFLNSNDKYEAKDFTPDSGSSAMSVQGDTAFLSIKGAIFAYANVFTQICGGTSLDTLTQDFNLCLENPNIKNIIFLSDSPGGEAKGISELANSIYQARNKKNIVSYVSGSCCSAAYWLCSATSKIYADKTALIGSIGAMLSISDDSEALKKDGIKNINIISSVSPKKNEDINTPEGLKSLQKIVDELGLIFATDVAKARGIDLEKVKSDFGQGGVMLGMQAKTQGLIDEISSLQEVAQIYMQAQNTTAKNMSFEHRSRKLKLLKLGV